MATRAPLDVYLLPGLGADHRLFAKLELGEHRTHFLDWPRMPKGSTLTDFARELASQVDKKRPHALVGVSMGGMVAQELAVLTGPERTVIISSWKGPHEMPPPIKLLRGTHPERLLTRQFIQASLPFMRWQMGVEGPEAVKLFDELLEVHTVEQLQVQIDAVLHWDGPAKPVKDLVHLHGTSDRLMPILFIKDPVKVPKGGHFMVFQRAPQVSRLVVEALH